MSLCLRISLVLDLKKKFFIHVHAVLIVLHGKFINDVGIMILFAPCVANTLVIIHVNLVLCSKVAVSATECKFFHDALCV